MENLSISKCCSILKQKLPDLVIKTNKTFKDLTSFKIGGKIRCLIEISSVNYLLQVMEILIKNKIDYFILGFGTNILASNKTFNKVVLKICLKEITVKNNQIICGAGVGIFKLNQIAIENCLSGLEWSYGIPGSVGGAIKMNAGSFGGEIKDVVKTVYFTDGKKIYKKEGSALNFSYRKSFFTDNNFIILKVIFSLKKGEKDAIEKLCFQNYTKRKQTQPYSLPSAGSVFKKPIDGFAPIYIEKCGLKGKKIGGAQISTKHCGFIVNSDSKAKFNDVFKLISKIKKTVSKKFDIMLEEEIIILK